MTEEKWKSGSSDVGVFKVMAQTQSLVQDANMVLDKLQRK